MCYYFDDTIKFQDFDLENILIDEKSHENVLVYNISYKNLIGNKPLHNRFDNIDGFIRIYDEITRGPNIVLEYFQVWSRTFSWKDKVNSNLNMTIFNSWSC